MKNKCAPPKVGTAIINCIFSKEDTNLLVNLGETTNNKNNNPNRSKPSHHQMRLKEKTEVNSYPILKGIEYRKLKPPSAAVISQKIVMLKEAGPPPS